MTSQAAAVPSGRMALVWASKDAGEGSQRPRVVRAALRAPGGRFGAARVLDPGEQGPGGPSEIGLAMARDGSATAIWTNVRGREPQAAVPGAHRDRAAGRRLRARDHARRQRSGRLGQRRARRPDAGDLEHRHLRLRAPAREQTDAFAALRPAGAAALGPPETLSSPALEDFAPAAAFDPLSGRPIAVWPAAVRTPFLSGYEQVRMQLATRTR